MTLTKEQKLYLAAKRVSSMLNGKFGTTPRALLHEAVQDLRAAVKAIEEQPS